MYSQVPFWVEKTIQLGECQSLASLAAGRGSLDDSKLHLNEMLMRHGQPCKVGGLDKLIN